MIKLNCHFVVVHEAVCGGDPELLKVVLEYRDLQKRSQRGDLVPNLLKRLKDVSGQIVRFGKLTRNFACELNFNLAVCSRHLIFMWRCDGSLQAGVPTIRF